MKQRLLPFLLIMALPLIALLAVSWSVSSAAVAPTAAPVPLTFEADIGVQLTSQPVPAVAGAEIRYSLVVTSDRPDLLPSLTVTLDIDNQIGSLSYETDFGNFNPDTGLWSDLSLSLLSPITLTITGTVEITAVNELVSEVLVTLPIDWFDPDEDNNFDQDTNPLTQQADLQVSKTAFPLTAVAGHPLTYTLSITNAGPSLATNVVLTDTLPPLTTFLDVNDNNCGLSGTLLVCQWDALDANATAEVELIASVHISASGQLTNTVMVSSDVDDPDLDNNSYTLITPVTPTAVYLTIEKSASSPTVIAGQSLTYTISVSNSGPAIATQVVLTDILPGGVTLAPVPPGCILTGAILTCDLPDILVGEEEELNLNVVVSPMARGSLINEAFVSAAEVNLNPTDSDETTTAVTAQADLILSKTAAPLTVMGRASFTYTLIVQNNGPSAALDAVLSDDWPAGMELLDAPVGCALTGGNVVCGLGALLPNADPLEIVLTARATTVNATADILLTNTAVVISDAGISNEASATVTITPYRLFLPITVRPSEWGRVGNIPTGVTAFYDVVSCGSETFAAANNGVYRLQGATWQRQIDGPPAVVLQLTFDGCDLVYAAAFSGTGQGGLWRGQRSGGSWTWSRLDTGLLFDSSRSVVVRDGVLYVAGNFGLYRSLNLNSTPPTFAKTAIETAVNSLTLDANGVTIYAAVWADGIYSNSDGLDWSKQGTTPDLLVWRAVGDGAGAPLLVGSETGLALWQNGAWVATAPAYKGRTRAVLATDGVLYAAQRGVGVIASYNNGQSWALMNTGLPAPASDSEYYNLRVYDDHLYVVTISGVWRWPLP